VIKRHARQINPGLVVFEMAATTRAGVTAWCDWLAARVPARHA
jgi:Ni2+-binding GTPase involved in maturation of urease and hydrogenase